MQPKTAASVGALLLYIQEAIRASFTISCEQLDTFNGDGTVFGSINGKALKELSVYLPSNDGIAHLQSLLEPIDAMIRRNDDEMQALEQLRDALLPKLMSGEIDISRIDLRQLNGHLVRLRTLVIVSRSTVYSMRAPFVG